MKSDLLKIIWFVTSSLSIGKTVSSFGIGEQIKNLINIPGVKDKISLLRFEKMRPPSISQERERLGHPKEKIREPIKKPKPPSKGHYLDDVPKQEVKKSSPKIDVSTETTVDTSVGADSLVTFEEVKLHLET